MSKDFYNILEVEKGANETDIKKAYRKLAMKWHPDKHQGDKKAEAKFKEINEAYQVLSDPEKKKQYDTFGSADFSGGFPGGGGGNGGFGGFDFGDIFGGGARAGGGQHVEFDLGDIFNNLGGMGGGRSAHSRSTSSSSGSLDMTSEIQIDLRDLLLGTKISVEGPDGKRFKFTIPENTKPGTKFKIKGKGKRSGSKTGNLYIKAQVKMPKKLTKKMREDIEKW